MLQPTTEKPVEKPVDGRDTAAVEPKNHAGHSNDTRSSGTSASGTSASGDSKRGHSASTVFDSPPSFAGPDEWLQWHTAKAATEARALVSDAEAVSIYNALRT